MGCTAFKICLCCIQCVIAFLHLWFVCDEYPWWRHQMETFSALLAICTGINRWVNNRESGDLIRYRAHCDVSVMRWWKYNISLLHKIYDLGHWSMSSYHVCCYAKYQTMQGNIKQNKTKTKKIYDEIDKIKHHKWERNIACIGMKPLMGVWTLNLFHKILVTQYA